MLLRFIKNLCTAAILIAIIGISVAAIYSRKQGGKLLSVQTESMVPVLKKGVLVSVKAIPAKNLQRGDIITFINPHDTRQTITHRIVETPSYKNAQHFVTKGDANPTTDVPIKKEAIIGKMEYSVPYAGRAADFIRKPIGLALIIYVPALLIVISELRRLAAYYKTQQVYRVPGRSNHIDESTAPSMGDIAKIVPVILFAFVLVSAPVVLAVAQTKVTLTKNTIHASRPTPPPPPSQCNTNSNTVNVSTTTTSNNSTNIYVTNSVSQSASSGSASSSNSTTGGSATSGSVSNCSNNSTTITIQ